MKTYYDPSTAGAKYLFSLKEYLRRADKDTKLVRTRFAKTIELIESLPTNELKQKLNEIKIQRMESPSLHESKLLTADIMLIEGELAKRNPIKKARSRRGAIENIFKDRAFRQFAKQAGKDKTREVLESVKSVVKDHHCPKESDEEVNSIIEGILSILFPS